MLNKIPKSTQLNSNTQIPISVNTTEWATNDTWAERIGNVVIVHVFCNGTPVNGKTICSGLPLPKKVIIIINGTGSPSVVAIAKNGTCTISSAGTNTASIIGCDIAYGV